jgi:hypothetical protein
MSWFVFGQVAGLGIRKAIAGASQNARHNANVRQAMNPATAAVIQPVLDIDRVITDGHFFQMGVPWGWRDLRPDEVDHSLVMLGIPVVVGAIAERTDQDAAFFLVSPIPMGGESISNTIMAADEMHRIRFSRVRNGRPLGSPQKIMIDGELGLLFHYVGDVDGAFKGQPDLPSVPVTTTECYFSRHGQGFLVTFIAGSTYHERYMPCFWTMFGSLRWLR